MRLSLYAKTFALLSLVSCLDRNEVSNNLDTPIEDLIKDSDSEVDQQLNFKESDDKPFIANTKLRILDSLADLWMSEEITDYKELEEEFVSNFPNDFNEFVGLYGYKESGELNEGYSFHEKHVLGVFCNLKTVSPAEWSRKCVNLLVNGFWQADAVGIVISKVLDNLGEPTFASDYFNVLQTLSEEKQQSFWQVIFSEYQVKQSIDHLSLLRKRYPESYEIMANTHSKSKFWRDTEMEDNKN